MKKNPRMLMLPATLLSTLFLSACGTTLIKSQADPHLSAVTMYMNLQPFVLDEVEIKNRSTGEVFSNRRYGWGKEFFAADKRFSFLAIGNVTPGEYVVSRIHAWTIIGQNQRVDMAVDMDPEAIRFTVQPNDIQYVGDILVIILKSEAARLDFIQEAAKLEERHVRGKVFPGRLIDKRTGTSFDFARDFASIWIHYPDGRSALRDGELPFLQFFQAKDLSGWADIAARKISTQKAPAP